LYPNAAGTRSANSLLLNQNKKSYGCFDGIYKTLMMATRILFLVKLAEIKLRQNCYELKCCPVESSHVFLPWISDCGEPELWQTVLTM
jgi:hypothetical protein